MANIKFFKKATRPTSADVGSVWFDSTRKAIVLTGATASEDVVYSGCITNAVVDGETLKLTKTDGNVITIDFAVFATDAALNAALTPINNSLGGKQDKTDSTLATTDKTISGAINEINTKVGNLTGALTWKGKFDTLPAVTDYKAGNVVGVGNKEYVLTATGTAKAWEELGDEGSYLLKSVAEETYLKKAAGEVATANIADGAVTSTKLATGARRPIILTPDTTEVDEETYQKLLSDDIDVVFKARNEIIYPLYSKEQQAHSNHLILIFAFPVCLTGPKTEITDDVNYTVRILPTGNHSVIITENKVTRLSTYLSANGYVTGDVVYKNKLSHVLKEIDLTGTDADRKAKLDKFETDWKELTGASDLTGARFVGKFGITDITEDVERNVTGIMTYCAGDTEYDTNDNCFYGICNGYSFNKQKSQIAVKVSCTDGSLTITPLFSNLEAIKIYDDEIDVADGYAQNLKNITAYKRNLEALGVDTSKPYIIPIGLWFNSAGIFTDTGFLQGPMPIEGRYQGYVNGRLIYINATTGKPSFEYLVTDTKISPIFEAITIYIDNTPEHMQANIDNIKAYEDNLNALVGYTYNNNHIIPIKFDELIPDTDINLPFGGFITTYGGYEGFITSTLAGQHKQRHIWISQGGGEEGKVYLDELAYLNESNDLLNTTSKDLIGAINEVNTLAKSKGNGTITEVKMNGVSKGTSGVVDLGTVITAHQDISGKVDKTLNAKAFEAITIKTSNSDTDMSANVTAIKEYTDNLTALGVDVTKGFNVPVKIGNFCGCLTGAYFGVGGVGFLSGSIFSVVGGEYYIKDIYIAPSGRYMELVNIMNDNDLNTTSKDLIGAINEVNTLTKNKQDKLTSGTNIKTINNQSLLGSGNIEISAPSITVDTTMSDTSTNPVQNKVIKAYIDRLVGNVAAWIEYE